MPRLAPTATGYHPAQIRRAVYRTYYTQLSYASALRTSMRLLDPSAPWTDEDALDAPWHTLTSEDVYRLRELLEGSGASPYTVRQYVHTVQRVLQQSVRDGQRDPDEVTTDRPLYVVHEYLRGRRINGHAHTAIMPAERLRAVILGGGSIRAERDAALAALASLGMRTRTLGLILCSDVAAPESVPRATVTLRVPARIPVTYVAEGEARAAIARWHAQRLARSSRGPWLVMVSERTDRMLDAPLPKGYATKWLRALSHRVPSLP